jgi:hypothetical protein
MAWLFSPAAVMIDQPWIAAVIGVACTALFLRRRRRSAAVAAVLWIAYCCYEYGMKLRVLCSGECNIRIDLLLIWPVLLVATLGALWQSRRRAPLKD